MDEPTVVAARQDKKKDDDDSSRRRLGRVVAELNKLEQALLQQLQQ